MLIVRREGLWVSPGSYHTYRMICIMILNVRGGGGPVEDSLSGVEAGPSRSGQPRWKQPSYAGWMKQLRRVDKRE